MNNEIAERWIAALRSGKYKQGVNWLRRDNKFCCLGVLCDIMGEKWDADSCHEISLPENIRVQAELKKNFVASLIWLNDTGKSFSEIADSIDEELARYNMKHEDN